MKTYTVYSNGEPFICKSFYDADTSTNGIDVYKQETNEHIGEIFGHTIPDEEDDDMDTINKFESMVLDWLENNFW